MTTHPIIYTIATTITLFAIYELSVSFYVIKIIRTLFKPKAYDLEMFTEILSKKVARYQIRNIVFLLNTFFGYSIK
jgi:hypothetical protein